MRKRFILAAALLMASAVAACGGPVATPSPNGSGAAPVPTGGPVLVGMGDSLTAGFQSEALLGVPTTSSASAYPSGAVYPGQESGWWAIVYDCLTSTAATCAHTPYSLASPSIPANASAAVLPLIDAPGLGTQIVLNATTLIADTQSACSAFNIEAYSSSGWQATRLNATAGIADLGVPGITMHEAVAMTAPLTGPPSATANGCGYSTIPGDPTSGGLQSLVQGESQLFNPILGEFRSAYGTNLTMLTVASRMAPKLTTVWLGANDLLKYTFSAGTSPASDTPQQMAADLTQIITKLTAAGSKVLVADLPTLLPTSGTPIPQFFPQSKLAADLTTLLVVNGIPASAAGTYAAAIVADLGSQYGVTAGGYLTESGFFGTVEQAAALIKANPATPNFAAIQLDPTTKGSGLGSEYLTPAFAAKVQTLNAAYNAAIDEVASNSGKNVALVPIGALITQASQSGVTVPGIGTLTLQFGGGLQSWDGLHPSNLGYAEIANEFIATADSSFGMTIPQLSALQLAQIASNDPYDPIVLKSVNPSSPFPLP
jgi:lysophospholipase L1-like esterase